MFSHAHRTIAEMNALAMLILRERSATLQPGKHSDAIRMLLSFVRAAGPALLVAAAYYTGTRIGFVLTPVEQPISTFWPPNAILLAALLLAKPQRWLGFLLAVLPVHLFVQLGIGVPLATALGWYISNTSEALLAAACLRIVNRGKPLFDNLWGVITFIFFGVFLAPFLTSFLDAAIVVLTGWGTNFWELWRMRLFSNMLAVLLIVPPITLAAGAIAWMKRATLRDWAELALLTSTTLLVAGVVVGTSKPSWSSVPVLMYTLLPLLLWSAVRFGSGAVSGSILAIALLSVWNALHGRGPFAQGTVAENAFSLQVFLGVTSVPLLALAAVVRERREMLEVLRSNQEWLKLDIAVRKMTEQELTDSQKRYAMATAAAGVAVWEWNHQTNSVYFDPVLPRILGYEREESQTHEDWIRHIHPGDCARVEATLKALSEEKPTFDLEYRVLHKDGSVKWLHHRGTALHHESPAIDRVVGTITDITQRKLALLALAESEQRFRQTADAAPMMVWMCGVDKLCNYVNRTWLDFTGRQLEDELGYGWLQSVHPDDVKECVSTFNAGFDSRRPFRMEYRVRRQDGEYRWILDHGVPRFDAEGIFLGFIGSAIDITDRKNAEETVMAFSGKLIQAQEEERRKIARELHDDVGQRLALLSIGLDKLRAKLSSSLRTGASRLCNQAMEISETVRDISHDLHSPGLDWLGLSAALKALLEGFGQQHSIQVSFREDDVPSQISADTKLTFYRVAQEALQNVTKHSEAHSVHLNLNTRDNKLVLQITDDGIGFALEQRPVLGLGIASMRERLRAIGGTITITSAPMRGTTVEASVPLH